MPRKEAMTPLVGPCGENSEDETQKRKQKQAMVQRLELEKWTPSTGFQTRVQIIGDSMLVINWMRGVWKIVDPRKKKALHHAHNALDEVATLATK